MSLSRIPPGGNAVPVTRLLKSGSSHFQELFSRHSGFPEENTFYTGSGTAALYLALLALKKIHPDRSEVVLPAWCCPSVPQAVLQAGLAPIQADLDPDSLSYVPESLEKAVTHSTLTVLLVHYFGIPQPKPKLSNPPPLFLRDCAQDFDFTNAKESDVAVFYSFGRGKSLNAGHGGALCLPEGSPLRTVCTEILESFPKATSSPLVNAALINLLSRPQLFGIVSSLPFFGIGETVWKHPMTFTRIHPEFFRIGSACFEALEKHRKAYAELAQNYIRTFSESVDISLPFTRYDERRLPVRFPVMVKNPALREKLRRELNRKFGGVTGQYPEILSRLPKVPDAFPKSGSYPGCEAITKQILTMPVTAWLLGREEEFLGETGKVLTKRI